MIFFKDPIALALQGEGHYGLRLTDISVTEEYVGLGKEQTRCQTEQFRVDCTTRSYRDIVLHTYNCAPANMRSYYGNQVTAYIDGIYTFDKVTNSS